MKYKIEKNTVQETLILPLYSRKLCTELYPNLYRDETAVHLIDQIDYDFSEAEENSRSLMQRFGALEVAMRQNDLAFEVQAYLKKHPCAAVVNLGCGLDNTGRACDNGSCKIYNLDFPDVIALRQQLLPAGESVRHPLHQFPNLLGQEVIEHPGGKEYRPAGGIDLVKPCGVFQVAGDVLLPLPGGQQLLPQGNNIREVQIVDFASAVVAGSAGVVQPAAQIDHRRAGVGFQIIPHLPRKVALPHGHLQRTEALHQAAGIFLCH